MRWVKVAMATVFLGGGASDLLAQRGRGGADEARPATQKAESANKPSDKEADHLSVTEGHVTVHGQELRYKATAGTLVMRDDTGKAKANMFFVAYEKQPAEDAGKRPITFLFNGGPGSSAVWLHLGAAGPKRVALDDEGNRPAPPYRLVDNEETWLAASDLVFIDPVGTGYSRPVEGEKPEQFYGYTQDLRSVSQFIRLYTTRYERWSSPKFLAGESYGTTRAAGLSNWLLNEGISVNGVVLISCVLNFQTISFGQGDDLPYALYLPTYTALAWYHKKLPADLQGDRAKALAESEDYARHGYLTEMAAGADLGEDAKTAAVKKLARLTGLDEKYIRRANLRVGPSEFRKALLADSEKVIGRYDGRLTGEDNRNPMLNVASYDPSYEAFLGAYSAAFNDYARRGLKFETDMRYDVLSGKDWDFGPAGNGYLNVSDQLRASLVELPGLRVMFCSGMYDLATPYLATKYTVQHLNVSPGLMKDISQGYYDAGHMIYHHREDREKLTKNVEAFIKESIPAATK
jgi:carboxypeptidase C (cathepsin A)